MKNITKFSTYNNGGESKLNVHYSDGTQFTRTITANEANALARTRDRQYLAELLDKYKDPQGRSESRTIELGERTKGNW